ncbi:unnamed protein product [Somion occarium]|uniref:RING-type domain-containing protein n=1 Tax=Somion occarium TaxID=3059160 RepID=A0ABP1D205_9APHY
MEGVMPMTTLQRIAQAIHKLPTLNSDEVPAEDSCPICLMSFSSICSGSLQNEGTLDICGRTVQLRGVTKLEGCGHVFCRVDLIEWIRGRHGTCPACRHTFLDVKPLSESDYGSSDGDYVPGEEDEEDDEDGFLDYEAFTEEEEMDAFEDFHFHSRYFHAEDEDGGGPGTVLPRYLSPDPGGVGHSEHLGLGDADAEDIEIDMDGVDEWADHEDESLENWGLSDGYGSESLSEGDISMPVADQSSGLDAAVIYSGDNRVSPPEASGSQGQPK